MATDSIWRTWKPYAAVVVVVVVGAWWWNSQSPMAQLKDGAYACVGVYVNDSGKYEILTDASGAAFQGTATIDNGELVYLVGSAPVAAEQLASLTMRKSGDSHFHVTDDPAMRMYNAIACDYSGS